MKIIQVLQFFSPKFGGTVNVIYNISKQLSKLGHDVTIITTDYGFDEEYAKSIKDMGVEVIKFKCIFNIASFLYSPSMKKWLNENLKEYDVIHMHNFRTYQQNIVFKYAKKYEIPYILQAHGAVLTFFQKQKLKQIYDHFWGNKLLENASNVIALTETESNQYMELGVPENKIKIIPNGIDLTEYQNLPKKGKFRKKYGIGENIKLILYLGRINKIKGLDLLLKSFNSILGEIGDIKMAIVGPDDGIMVDLKNLTVDLGISDDVLFTGPLYGKNKIEAYIDADIYMLPSIYETFPMAILESLVCGTPVIVTDRCGISDIIKNNNVGLVTNYDKTDLESTMINMLSNYELRKEYGYNGKKLIENNLNWAKITPKIENIYKDVIKSE